MSSSGSTKFLIESGHPTLVCWTWICDDRWHIWDRLCGKHHLCISLATTASCNSSSWCLICWQWCSEILCPQFLCFSDTVAFYMKTKSIPCLTSTFGMYMFDGRFPNAFYRFYEMIISQCGYKTQYLTYTWVPDLLHWGKSHIIRYRSRQVHRFSYSGVTIIPLHTVFNFILKQTEGTHFVSVLGSCRAGTQCVVNQTLVFYILYQEVCKIVLK